MQAVTLNYSKIILGYICREIIEGIFEFIKESKENLVQLTEIYIKHYLEELHNFLLS